MDNRERRRILELHEEKVAKLDLVDHGRLYWKVDRRILPLMFLCYFLTFLDKVVINYANVMGLQQSLNMSGQQFSWAITAFFIGYAFAEFPQGYMLQNFSPAKVLGLNVLCWAILLCATAAVHNYTDLVIVRTLLGCFEAIIAPALVMITSQWYTKRQAAPRTGVWFSGLGVGQILGGLISFAGQHGSLNGSLPGWKIMFIVVGVLNLVAAGAILIWLPSDIESASFLDEEEKHAIRTALVLDQGGNGKRVFKLSSLGEAIGDLQVWLLFLIAILDVIPSGAISAFSTTMISGFGYTPKQAALLNMPSGVVNITATLLGTFIILKDFPRWMGICVLVIPAIIGAGLMSFYKGGQGGSLAGVYLINFDVAPMALVYSWVGSNVQGYTKRIAVNAILAIGVSIGSIIGPQTFLQREAPQYLTAKIVVFAANGGVIGISILLRLLYGYRNKETARNRKMELERLDNGIISLSDVETQDRTDKTNPTFQYVY